MVPTKKQFMQVCARKIAGYANLFTSKLNQQSLRFHLVKSQVGHCKYEATSNDRTNAAYNSRMALVSNRVHICPFRRPATLSVYGSSVPTRLCKISRAEIQYGSLLSSNSLFRLVTSRFLKDFITRIQQNLRAPGSGSRV